ncbi:ABC transporter permease subunit [Nocardia cyriacigeorgica]|uniref:ABC transporter permease subunit n=1 Tax=Nocardia cyriacigeorgica TaxID=135487 RepID=UPI002456546D|nr:ABC transporter permease subunit [Nocardia cyriacigeorgica]
MKRTVFTQTLKEQRRGLIGWSIGLAIVPMIYLPSYQSLKEQGSLDIQQNSMYDAMGLSDFASGTGFLNSTVYSLMGLLLMLIFAVTIATRTATQEENGSLDLLLAQPISRTRLLVQRFAALAVQVAVVSVVLTVSVIAGANSGNIDVATGNIVAASAGLGLLALFAGPSRCSSARRPANVHWRWVWPRCSPLPDTWPTIWATTGCASSRRSTTPTEVRRWSTAGTRGISRCWWRRRASR